MPDQFDPRTEILPPAQKEIWPHLVRAPKDQVLLVASPEDLLATKLKAILDRAEAKDYRDISALLAAGVSLESALGAFVANYRRDPALPLKALGFFKDGDLPSLAKADQDLLREARDRVTAVPELRLSKGLLPT